MYIIVCIMYMYIQHTLHILCVYIIVVKVFKRHVGLIKKITTMLLLLYNIISL